MVEPALTTMEGSPGAMGWEDEIRDASVMLDRLEEFWNQAVREEFQARGRHLEIISEQVILDITRKDEITKGFRVGRRNSKDFLRAEQVGRGRRNGSP